MLQIQHKFFSSGTARGLRLVYILLCAIVVGWIIGSIKLAPWLHHVAGVPLYVVLPAFFVNGLICKKLFSAFLKNIGHLNKMIDQP